MAQYGIQSAAFSQAIHVGRLNKDGTAFTSKQDVTDDALYAVARFVQNHFAGSMAMTFTGLDEDHADFTLTIAVDPRPAPTTGVDHA